MKSIDKIIKFRHILYFISCLLILFSILFLHGSIYRFVQHIDGKEIIIKDDRSIGVFNIYLVISLTTIVFVLFNLVIYLINVIRNNIKTDLVFIILLTIFLIILIISLIVLRIRYV